MATNIPHFRGQNVVLKFYQNNRPVYLQAKNWEVEENASEIAEGVNGENRDRLDKVTNYYTATVDVYQTDQEVVQAYIDAQEADDANQLPLKQTMAIQITQRDGVRAAYVLQEVKAGPMKVSMTGRADAVMLNLRLRFRYMKRVQAI